MSLFVHTMFTKAQTYAWMNTHIKAQELLKQSRNSNARLGNIHEHIKFLFSGTVPPRPNPDLTSKVPFLYKSYRGISNYW